MRIVLQPCFSQLVTTVYKGKSKVEYKTKLFFNGNIYCKIVTSLSNVYDPYILILMFYNLTKAYKYVRVYTKYVLFFFNTSYIFCFKMWRECVTTVYKIQSKVNNNNKYLFNETIYCDPVTSPFKWSDKNTSIVYPRKTPFNVPLLLYLCMSPWRILNTLNSLQLEQCFNDEPFKNAIYLTGR